MGHVISLLGHKGGSTRTSSSVNIGASLGRMGKKVILFDFDFQANSTFWLLNQIDPAAPTITSVLLEKSSISEAIQTTSTENLSILPADDSLKDIAGMNPTEVLYRLQVAMETFQDYDYILLDHAPSLSLTTLIGLVSSQYVLVPVASQILPVVGASQVVKTIEKAKKDLRHQINLLGYILTMYDPRTKVTREIESFMKENFQDLLFESRVRINTKIAEAPGLHQTAWEMGDERGASDYENVSRELIRRIENVG